MLGMAVENAGEPSGCACIYSNSAEKPLICSMSIGLRINQPIHQELVKVSIVLATDAVCSPYLVVVCSNATKFEGVKFTVRPADKSLPVVND